LRNTSNTNGSMSLISFQDAAGFGNANIGAIQTDQTNHKADIVFLSRNATTFGERMRIKSDGTVGIGTTTPAYSFDVEAGQVNATGGICIAGDCKPAWSQVGNSSQWTTAGDNVYYNTDNVGIGGNTAPAYKLDVQGGQVNASGGICI